MKKCNFCEKEIEDYVNYCSWDCHVEEAKQSGCEVNQPNGLPIKCIKFDGSMWEHEHADHPSYVFPVDAVFVGTEDERLDCGVERETHALVYTDGNVAVTLYDASYYFWALFDGGKCKHHPYDGQRAWAWKLTDESINKIRSKLEEKTKNEG